MSWINPAYDDSTAEISGSLDEFNVPGSITHHDSRSPIISHHNHASPALAAKDMPCNTFNSTVAAGMEYLSSVPVPVETIASAIGLPSLHGSVLHNGSSHPSFTVPANSIMELPQVKCAMPSLLLAPEPALPSLPPAEDQLTTCPILDLDSMTANELCEDIAYTQQTLGLMAITKEKKENGCDVPPQLVSPPSSVSHTPPEMISPAPSPLLTHSSAVVSPSPAHTLRHEHQPTHECSASFVFNDSLDHPLLSSSLVTSPHVSMSGMESSTAPADNLSTSSEDVSAFHFQHSSHQPNQHGSAALYSQSSQSLQLSFSPSQCTQSKSFNNVDAGLTTNSVSYLSVINPPSITKISCTSDVPDSHSYNASHHKHLQQKSSLISFGDNLKSLHSSSCSTGIILPTSIKPEKTVGLSYNSTNDALRSSANNAVNRRATNGTPASGDGTPHSDASSTNAPSTSSTVATAGIQQQGALGRPLSEGAGGGGAGGSRNPNQSKRQPQDYDEDATSHENSTSSDSSQDSNPNQSMRARLAPPAGAVSPALTVPCTTPATTAITAASQHSSSTDKNNHKSEVLSPCLPPSPSVVAVSTALPTSVAAPSVTVTTAATTALPPTVAVGAAVALGVDSANATTTAAVMADHAILDVSTAVLKSSVTTTKATAAPVASVSSLTTDPPAAGSEECLHLSSRADTQADVAVSEEDFFESEDLFAGTPSCSGWQGEQEQSGESALQLPSSSVVDCMVCPYSSTAGKGSPHPPADRAGAPPPGQDEALTSSHAGSGYSSSSSASVLPNSDSSSDERVLVQYSKLKRSNKDYEISPTIERRRMGLSEARVASSVCRKVTFGSDSSSTNDALHYDCQAVKGAAVDIEDDEVTVLDTIDQSLEVVYDKRTEAAASASCDSPIVLDASTVSVESQDISLFLQADTQTIDSQVAFMSQSQVVASDSHSKPSVGNRGVSNTSNSDVESETFARMPSTDSLECHDTLSSSSGDSQVIAGTIEPTQLESLLSAHQLAKHSQSPVMAPLLEEPLKHCTGVVLQPSSKVVLRGAQQHQLKSVSSHHVKETKPRDSAAQPVFDSQDETDSKKEKLATSSAEKTDSTLSLSQQEPAQRAPGGVEDPTGSSIQPSVGQIEAGKSISHCSQSQIIDVDRRPHTPIARQEAAADEIKHKRSPTKYKDDCHQSLLVESNPYSQSNGSGSSSSSSDNLAAASQETLGSPSQVGKPSRDSEMKLEGSGQVGSPSRVSTETESSSKLHNIALVDVAIPEKGLSVSFDSSGTVVAKASKAAQDNIEAEKKRKEEAKCLEHQKALLTDASFDECAVRLRKASATPSSSSDMKKKVSHKEHSSESSDSFQNLHTVSGRDARRTSTPNLSQPPEGVSPNLSGESRSCIEKRDAAEIVLERNDSTRTTLELVHDIPEARSFKTIEDLRAGGFKPLVGFVKYHVTAWEHPTDLQRVFSIERGDEEAVIYNLSFTRKVSKIDSSDRRVSDVSAMTSSSSSGYQADKSSSSSTCSRRMSTLSIAESAAAKHRMSIESVQIVSAQISSPPKDEMDDPSRVFAQPSHRALKTKSPSTHAINIEDTSSSDDREALRTSMGYGSFKAFKSKKIQKRHVKSSIKEETESDIRHSAAQSGAAEIVDLTLPGSTSPVQSEQSSSKERPVFEMKSSPKPGIVNKGLHYDLDKFFDDLPSSIVNVLKSVQLSEDEEDMFIKECSNMSSLDVLEEQARMVITRMINIKLAPNSLVFAKYHDHYYSAVIESEHPSGGWNIRYTLDGFQKHCPLDHILPIDILPRGQHCFRRYQGPGNNKSIISVRVVIKGHTVENNTVLHIAADLQQTFKVPHSHLSMQLNDAERFINAWKVTQSIVSSGPEVSMTNIIEGKRRRITPALSSPGCSSELQRKPTPSKSGKPRVVRKQKLQKPDPYFDTSLTETEASVTSLCMEGEAENEGEQQRCSASEGSSSGGHRQPKKRKIGTPRRPEAAAIMDVRSPLVTSSPGCSRLHEVRMGEMSDDETYSPVTKTAQQRTSRKRTPRLTYRKKPVTPKTRGSAVSSKDPNVGEGLTPVTTTPIVHSQLGDVELSTSAKSKHVVDTSTERAPIALAVATSVSDFNVASVEGSPVSRKRGRKPKNKDPATSAASGASPARKEPATDLSVSVNIPHTPRKRGRPPGSSATSSKIAKLELSRVDDVKKTEDVNTTNDSDDIKSSEHPSITSPRRSSTASTGSVSKDITGTPKRRGRTRTSTTDMTSPGDVVVDVYSLDSKQSRTPAATTTSTFTPTSVSTAVTTVGSTVTTTPVRGQHVPGSTGRGRAGRGRRLLASPPCGLDPIREREDRAAAGEERSSSVSPLRDEPLLGPETDPRLGTVPLKGSTLFKAPPPLNKRHLSEQIRAGGGKVITKFEEADLIRVRCATFSTSNTSAECSESPQLLLICDKYCRTTKYIQCLAVGIPIVSHVWVITACDMNQRLSWCDYLLPAGINIASDSLVEQSCSKKHSTGGAGVTVRDTPLLEGDVVFVATSSNPQFAAVWLPLLASAAAEVRRATKTGTSLGRILDRKTTLVLADASIPEAELSRARQLGKPVVSSQWFIQSVIVGYKLPCDYHASFRHDA